jgi:hypothetical protein
VRFAGVETSLRACASVLECVRVCSGVVESDSSVGACLWGDERWWVMGGCEGSVCVRFAGVETSLRARASVFECVRVCSGVVESDSSVGACLWGDERWWVIFCVMCGLLCVVIMPVCGSRKSKDRVSVHTSSLSFFQNLPVQP